MTGERDKERQKHLSDIQELTYFYSDTNNMINLLKDKNYIVDIHNR